MGKCLVCGGSEHFKKECILLGMALHRELNFAADVVDLILRFLLVNDKLVSCSQDRAVKIWSRDQTGLLKCVSTINGEKTFRSIALSPDGKFLAASDGDTRGGSVRLFSAETGDSIGPSVSSERTVYSVAWSPDGRTLAVGDGDWRCGSIQLYNAETGDSLRAFASARAHRSFLRSVAWSPCGKMLASGGDDKMLYTFDARTGEVRPLASHADFVWSVAWSPCGKLLASGGDGKVIYLWDAETGQARCELRAHRCESPLFPFTKTK
jgi:WD40 repeat protein